MAQCFRIARSNQKRPLKAFDSALPTECFGRGDTCESVTWLAPVPYGSPSQGAAFIASWLQGRQAVFVVMYDTSPPAKDVWIRQTAAAEIVRDLSSSLGIDAVLPVKGVVTARTLYADPSERPVADVDLRVREHDLVRVVAFARERGHRVRSRSAAYAHVVIDVNGLDADVETHVGPPGLCGLDVAAMLARATRGDAVFGFPCLVPELHDHVLLLVVNAFKDKLVLAPSWSVEDLVRFAARPELDPARLAELATETRSRTLTWFVAQWLAPRSEGWRAIEDALGRPTRRSYTRLYGWLAQRAPEALVTRLAMRWAPDAFFPRLRGTLAAVRFDREKH